MRQLVQSRILIVSALLATACRESILSTAPPERPTVQLAIPRSSLALRNLAALDGLEQELKLQPASAAMTVNSDPGLFGGARTANEILPWLRSEVLRPTFANEMGEWGEDSEIAPQISGKVLLWEKSVLAFTYWSSLTVYRATHSATIQASGYADQAFTESVCFIVAYSCSAPVDFLNNGQKLLLTNWNYSFPQCLPRTVVGVHSVASWWSGSRSIGTSNTYTAPAECANPTAGGGGGVPQTEGGCAEGVWQQWFYVNGWGEVTGEWWDFTCTVFAQ